MVLVLAFGLLPHLAVDQFENGVKVRPFKLTINLGFRDNAHSEFLSPVRMDRYTARDFQF
jgi:N-methylhydantoinase B/oxoprolinase/acetone carboxylase alpha subunit